MFPSHDRGVLVQLSGNNAAGQIRNASDGSLASPSAGIVLRNDGGDFTFGNTSPYDEVFYDPADTLKVSINENAVSVNALREAFRLQEFLELDAMGGTRYTELIFTHFGVRSKDARLNRPELIGSFRGTMTISEVLQTAPGFNNVDDAGSPTPLGTMAGHGISVNGGRGLNYYATEHGIIMGLINVQPRTAYQQGS